MSAPGHPPDGKHHPCGLRETIDGYSEVHTKAENINIDIRKAHYALLPVWMLHTRWNDKDFLFAMNGQTGKLIGDPARGP